MQDYWNTAKNPSGSILNSNSTEKLCLWGIHDPQFDDILQIKIIVQLFTSVQASKQTP